MATMRGKSYLSIGGVSMGIAGSIVNEDFFQQYLGMRNEYVDMTEVTRRINENIYDPEEFKKAMEWTRKYCKEGKDYNPKERQKDKTRKDYEWEFVVKMTIICRDLMIGNPRLVKTGIWRRSTRT